MPPSRPIRIGSRGSRLARLQVEEVRGLLRAAGTDLAVDHKIYDSAGDKDLTSSLKDRPGDDFFTDTLDRALAAGEIDAAVHSAKDLPQHLAAAIDIAALTVPLDETDAIVGPQPLAELPRGARIGTSSTLRWAALQDSYPKLQLTDIRGTIEQRIALLDEGRYDAIVVATCALKRLGLTDRIAEIAPWDGAPLQGQLAVTVRAGDAVTRNLFAPIDIRRRFGKVWLVGAGPGDPELITLKAVRLLQAADTVFYDYLLNPELLKLAPAAEKIDVGKRKGVHSLPQAELCRRLRARAVRGEEVVRLKGGDPFIFGRGAEELEYLRAYHIPVEVVPGVSSAAGVPADLGVPLTARGVSSSVAFVSGHGQRESVDGPQPVVFSRADTLVFLMGLTKLPEIAAGLRDQGWGDQTPVMIVSRGTWADQKVLVATLADVVERAEAGDLPQPALIIVGHVVNFYRPAGSEGKVLYLGTHPQKYRFLGELVHFPMIEIRPTAPDRTIVDTFLAAAGPRLIVLTSRFGVRCFFQWLAQQGWQERVSGIDIAVIGEETAAALRAEGLKPVLTADDETGPGLVAALQSAGLIKGRTILLPRSALPNPPLLQALDEAGTDVRTVIVYDNIKPAWRPLPRGPFSRIVFTSPSTVRNFLADYGAIPEGWAVVSRGPTTAAALKAAGYASEVLVFSAGIR